MWEETIRSDVTVVGGGLAGVCAAIGAARLGRTVTLVNNRPVLGGNSSSEVRVWVCGATSHGGQSFARETGIMGELFVENQYRNPEGNPYLWDTTVLDAVLAEPNITLLLNTDVRDVEADGPEEDRTIRSVTGWMMGSERVIRMESPVFLDCTGDGLVGYLAGARHRVGREARAEYGEPWAPDVADQVTLGSTLLFYTKDAGEPVRYVPPRFAKDITATTIPERRIIRSGDNGCAYWWIEWGGDLDTVRDDGQIRDELWSVIYGIWDYIKNSGKFDADTMTLEWVGSMPGKREYRRLLGDYVLTQHDVVDQTAFADRVAFGGWSIDLHPPGGMYAAAEGSKHWHTDGVFHIPYRSLYSQNVSNLFMAGRNISASHVAFGATRVMATCATMGQAAGVAAGLCAATGRLPRFFAGAGLEELHLALQRQDASVSGIAVADPLDVARLATVTASGSTTSLVADADDVADEPWSLDADLGIVLPVDPWIQDVELLVNADVATVLEVEVNDPVLPQNYVPRELVDKWVVDVPAGAKQWVRLPGRWTPSTPRNAFLVVRANPAVSLHVANHATPGVLCLSRVPVEPEEHGAKPVREWAEGPLRRRTVCLRVGSPTRAFGPENVIDGYTRPYAGPHMWVSEPIADTWLQLTWTEPVTIGSVEVILDDDLNEDLINLHHHRTPFDIMPTLIRDYRIEASVDGGWRTLVEVQENRARHRVHHLLAPVPTAALRLIPITTNGVPSAHVVALRAYPPTTV